MLRHKVKCTHCGWSGKEEEVVIKDDCDVKEAEYCPECNKKNYLIDVLY